MRMTTIFGIYGFQITKPIEVAGLKITPISTEHTKAKLLARDESKYNLTAIAEGDNLSDEDVFLIEGVLSFIEHLDVKLARPFDGSNSAGALTPVLLIQKRPSGGGSVIGEDTFFPDSRKQFIEHCLTKLKDKAFCAESKLNSLLFKIIETFRLRSPFIEIQFFLLFSALESHARAIQNEPDKRNAAEPICKTLTSYGFDVTQEISKTPARAIATYAQLRNSIFHRNELSTIVKNSSGEEIPLDAFQSYFNLSMLASLTVMKVVGFDDGHINWDAWIDRQLFK
jgi:hypothetical protein